MVQNFSGNEIGAPFCEAAPSLQEVSDAVSSSANFKAAGLDLIFNEALKHGGSHLCSSLHLLFTSVWQSELTPRAWSRALIHLIPKGHDADMLLPSSYRPISLTSSVSKIFEKVLLGRLDCYAAASDLLPAEQAGFRKGFSPLEQTYILREILDSRKQLPKSTTFLCFVDLQSAFPSCWREGMWRRLHEANISGKMLRVIQSLYKECSSALLTDSGLSDWFPVSTGTRQGAVLSPFLFSLLISPLVDELHALNMGVDFFGLRIGCLLFADDIVLIAESQAALQSMMTVAAKFFQRWRFTVSDLKTNVISLGHCETRDLKDRTWHMGSSVIHDVKSYTYLGIEFDKSGNWLAALRKNVQKCRHSMGQLYSFTDDPDQGLDVGHLADLWGLFARSRLLYGSEIWSTHSPSALESLETAQTVAGKQILGKPGGSNLIREAVYGDLGWLSIRSHLRLAKLRFYGRLLRLPDDRLAKRVFLLSRQHLQSLLVTVPPSQVPSSWCKDLFEVLAELGIQSWWEHFPPPNLMASASAFKHMIHQCVRQLDEIEWLTDLSQLSPNQSGLSAREHYCRLKVCKAPEAYLYNEDRKSALFKFYLRARNFGLNARTQHGDPGPSTSARKACSFCTSALVDEDEEHFVLVCPTYAASRRIMWLNIEGNLSHCTLVPAWLDISLSPPRTQLDFLLGYTKVSWHPEVGTVIDRHFRQFLLSAALTRKTRLAQS